LPAAKSPSQIAVLREQNDAQQQLIGSLQATIASQSSTLAQLKQQIYDF